MELADQMKVFDVVELELEVVLTVVGLEVEMEAELALVAPV